MKGLLTLPLIGCVALTGFGDAGKAAISNNRPII